MRVSLEHMCMPRRKTTTTVERSFDEIKKCHVRRLYIQSWEKRFPRDLVQVGRTPLMHCPLDTFRICARVSNRRHVNETVHTRSRLHPR
jgi:hypothetical protein